MYAVVAFDGSLVGYYCAELMVVVMKSFTRRQTIESTANMRAGEEGRPAGTCDRSSLDMAENEMVLN